MHYTTLHKQKGLTLISWMVIFVFLGFHAVIAINIIPVYMTDSSIKSIWAGLPHDSSLAGTTVKNIRETVIKRLKINNVYALKKDDIKIRKVKNDYVVSVMYEPRGKIIGSLDYIVTFKHEARIRAR